jgi:hypothetical protein
MTLQIKWKNCFIIERKIAHHHITSYREMDSRKLNVEFHRQIEKLVERN